MHQSFENMQNNFVVIVADRRKKFSA